VAQWRTGLGSGGDGGSFGVSSPSSSLFTVSKVVSLVGGSVSGILKGADSDGLPELGSFGVVVVVVVVLFVFLGVNKLLTKSSKSSCATPFDFITKWTKNLLAGQVIVPSLYCSAVIVVLFLVPFLQATELGGKVITINWSVPYTGLSVTATHRDKV